MTEKEFKKNLAFQEQLQEDILSILEGFGVDEAMEGSDYNNLVTALCDAVIVNVKKLDK